MNLEIKLHDPFADARRRLFGGQKYAYLYGSDVYDENTPSAEAVPRGTDLLTLNHLAVPFSFMPIPRNYARKKWIFDFDEYDCLFNGVTNPDTNPRVLSSMVKHLKGYRGRVINHPVAVLNSGRDAVSRRLRGIPGLHAPPTIRFRGAADKTLQSLVQRAGISFPAILRRAGAHRGSATRIVSSLAEMPELERDRAYYLTSFVEYRSPDGLYRKVRFFFLGDEIVIRDRFVSPNWNVQPEARRGFMATRPDLVEEERLFIEAGFSAFPETLPSLLAIVRERVGLDYFGLDCGFWPDGTLILFEANASMNFNPASEKPPFGYLHSRFQLGREGFNSLLSPNYRCRSSRLPAAKAT